MRFDIRIKQCKAILFLCLCLFPWTLHASFIESTIGTAVVNDATATYYNPSALTLLKNSQIITLGSIAYFRTQFTGQSIQSATGFTQSGSTNTNTHYYLPSLYLGVPVTDKMTVGLAIISNSFNNHLEDNSLLRYVQSKNRIQGNDVVLGAGVKFTEFFSLGAGINVSNANFLLQPITGLPSLNIPDSQSRNEASGSGFGGEVGFLIHPTRATLIGFNYRSGVTYKLSGKSVFEGNPKVISNHYYFDFWTPARSVLSINQFVTPTLGFITTIQRIQWNRFKNVNLHGIATQVGSKAIVLNASVPFHLENAWIVTLGSHYHVTPKWIVRVAGTYNQSPGNPHYQIANGDSIILGASMSYEVYKHLIIDGSYAHAFIQNEDIDIVTNRNSINGVNQGSRDAVSLKLTFNI